MLIQPGLCLTLSDTPKNGFDFSPDAAAAHIVSAYILGSEPVSPVRFLIAVWAPVLVAQWGLSRKSLDRSGALAG